MTLIDGKKIADQILDKLKREISAVGGRPPGLAFILIGNDPASNLYVEKKQVACEHVGIQSHIINLDEKIDEKELLKEIEQLNLDETIDGIIVQQPLPPHIDTSLIVTSISPQKDVDGFHPLNLGKLMLGDQSGLIPCTPLGIFTLLQECGIETESKHVVILGRSNIVGKPLATLLSQKRKGANATVTIAHSMSENLPSIASQADILISAVGKAALVTPQFVKPGAVVIDVGVNRADGSVVGDVDFDAVSSIASHITPVPGGVGPMTIAMLLKNTFICYT